MQACRVVTVDDWSFCMQYCTWDASRIRPRGLVGGRPRGRRGVLYDRVRICTPAGVRALPASDPRRHAHPPGRVPPRAVRALGVGPGAPGHDPDRSARHPGLQPLRSQVCGHRSACGSGRSRRAPARSCRRPTHPSPASGSRFWPIPRATCWSWSADGEAGRQGRADHRNRRRPGSRRGTAVRRRGRDRARVRPRRRAGRGGHGGDPRGWRGDALHGAGRPGRSRRRCGVGRRTPPSAPAGSTSSTTTPRRRGWGRSRSSAGRTGGSRSTTSSI